MITDLHLKNVGPADELRASFGKRLNLVTGDNGLGKTFLLDACWYALTKTWIDDLPFIPNPGEIEPPESMELDFTVNGSFVPEGFSTKSCGRVSL